MRQLAREFGSISVRSDRGSLEAETEPHVRFLVRPPVQNTAALEGRRHLVDGVCCGGLTGRSQSTQCAHIGYLARGTLRPPSNPLLFAPPAGPRPAGSAPRIPVPVRCWLIAAVRPAPPACRRRSAPPSRSRRPWVCGRGRAGPLPGRRTCRARRFPAAIISLVRLSTDR